jgi:hypothetical protein
LSGGCEPGRQDEALDTTQPRSSWPSIAFDDRTNTLFVDEAATHGVIAFVRGFATGAFPRGSVGPSWPPGS